jgi:Ca2+-transporting ATPase
MAAYVYGLARYGRGAQASTMAFLSLTAAQLLYGITARAQERGAQLAPNPAMRNGLLVGFALLAASQFIPGLTSMLGTSRIGLLDALACAGAALGSFFVNEAAKPPAGDNYDSERNFDHGHLQHRQ